MTETKRQLIVKPRGGYPPAIGAELWRLEDANTRTLEAINGITQAELDWQAPGLQNTVGTLLYHLSIIEIDWLYEEVLVEPMADEVMAWFPYTHRTSTGRLTPVSGVSLGDHLKRYHWTRQHFFDRFKGMTEDDFVRTRQLEPYDVTPEWVVHHIAQHEDEHRGEITTIRTLYKATHS